MICKNPECSEIRKERDKLGLEYSRARRNLSWIYNFAMDGKLTPKELLKVKEIIEQMPEI